MQDQIIKISNLKIFWYNIPPPQKKISILDDIGPSFNNCFNDNVWQAFDIHWVPISKLLSGVITAPRRLVGGTCLNLRPTCFSEIKTVVFICEEKTIMMLNSVGFCLSLNTWICNFVLYIFIKKMLLEVVGEGFYTFYVEYFSFNPWLTVL